MMPLWRTIGTKGTCQVWGRSFYGLFMRVLRNLYGILCCLLHSIVNFVVGFYDGFLMPCISL